MDRKTGGELANLSGRDLSGLKFGKWDLRHASFTGACRFGINALDTRFCYCDFTAADLSHTKPLNCDSRNAVFKRVRLFTTIIAATQLEWPLPLAEEEVWYCGGGLIGANFDEAEINTCTFAVQLDNAYFID